jgi:hypothetical protein
MTGWHFDPRDTPQQRTVLRRSTSAQQARIRFPAGQRVTTGRATGTVERHVPGYNSQGGHLVVRWDNGHVGRVGTVAVSRP